MKQPDLRNHVHKRQKAGFCRILGLLIQTERANRPLQKGFELLDAPLGDFAQEFPGAQRVLARRPRSASVSVRYMKA